MADDKVSRAEYEDVVQQYVAARAEVEEMNGLLLVTEAKAKGLSFRALREANVTRCKRWHPGFLSGDADEWTGADWSNAMCGEAGETANVVKKLRRVETGTAPGPDDPSPDRLKEMLADELADTVTYADLLAAHYGIDLAEAVARKFNRVSERQGFPDRLPAALSPSPDSPKPSLIECQGCGVQGGLHERTCPIRGGPIPRRPEPRARRGETVKRPDKLDPLFTLRTASEQARARALAHPGHHTYEALEVRANFERAGIKALEDLLDYIAHLEARNKELEGLVREMHLCIKHGGPSNYEQFLSVPQREVLLAALATEEGADRG